MRNNLKYLLEEKFNFILNNNQLKDIARLFHEIIQRDEISDENIIRQLEKNDNIGNSKGKDKFQAIKRKLITLRFPLTSSRGKINSRDVYLNELKPPLRLPDFLKKDFVPEKIFIEMSAKNSYLLKRFNAQFPDTPQEELNHLWEYAQKHRFKLEDLKRPLVFIAQENWDFIKRCPCTKDHLGCNYWIFNLGFGCPYDCSYCFLQQYSNFPGIVLPANLDDFFEKFDSFFKKINRPIRIGTGEFCDSLALDDITGYSKQLVDFFRDKPVFFELKTKSANISNLLSLKGAPNIIISWSLNPQELIDSQEFGTAGLIERLQAAKQVRKNGYSLAFHFDPVIYSKDWEKSYKQVIKQLYKCLEPGFKWISIGTLRGTRKLKSASELRFEGKNIFYGELLLGSDKKLRYPKFLRKEVYTNMLKWIRSHDTKTPVYLCMEDTDCWQIMDKKLTSAKQIENYLLANNTFTSI
ncbi:MAG: hypothetical protein L6416_11975 [Candidatus Omnitrophica bacterium]|nr:hypothetical protein [Candidatus Omnitrophota bacterium]